MKVNEIRFEDYEYERVCVLTEHFAENYPPKTEEAVVRNHGEEELAETDGVTVVDGWLMVRLACSVREEEEDDAAAPAQEAPAAQ